jgi:DNA-binding response OmpR family regulator
LLLVARDVRGHTEDLRSAEQHHLRSRSMETIRKHSTGSDMQRSGTEGLYRPFSVEFRPFGMLPPLPPRASCGELEVDRAERRAALADHQLRLTAREYALLLCLVNRASRAVRRSEILAEIWMQPDDGSNVVDVYVRRLRRKFGEHAGMIQTVRGFGYRLRPPEAA